MIGIFAKKRAKFKISAVFGHFRSIWALFRSGNGHVRYSNVHPECYLVSQRHIEKPKSNCKKLRYTYYAKISR